MKRLFLSLALAISQAGAQCVMCQRTAAAQNAARVQVFNTAILVLGIPPFFILTGIVLLAWRRSGLRAEGEAAPTAAVQGERLSHCPRS